MGCWDRVGKERSSEQEKTTSRRKEENGQVRMVVGMWIRRPNIGGRAVAAESSMMTRHGLHHVWELYHQQSLHRLHEPASYHPFHSSYTHSFKKSAEFELTRLLYICLTLSPHWQESRWTPCCPTAQVGHRYEFFSLNFFLFFFKQFFRTRTTHAHTTWVNKEEQSNKR